MKKIEIFAIASLMLLALYSCDKDEQNEISHEELTCSITSPTNGIEITIGDIVTILVDAYDIDGNITEVKFNIDGAYMGSSSSIPYSFQWHTRFANLGSHVLKAIAYDNSGATKSSEINVTIIEDGSNQQYSWTQISNFPGLARDEAVSFTIDNYGYVGLGSKNQDKYKDFYKYNPASDTWTQLTDFGGIARNGAVAFAIDGDAYVGLGYGHNGSWGELYDFWKYNASIDTWIQLNDFPGSGTVDASCFVIGSKGYVVDKYSYIYEYDPALDTWTNKTDFPGVGRQYAVAFTIGSKAYFGTGFYDVNSTRLKDLWEYDPSADSWTQKANFPGTARNSAVSFTIGNYGFIGTGNNFMQRVDDFWCYDPINDSWEEIDSYPPGDGNGLVSFIIGDIAYVGTGYVGEWFANHTTRFYKVKSN